MNTVRKRKKPANKAVASKPVITVRSTRSNMESEPIDPSILEKVRAILRTRGFKGYQETR